MRAQYNNSLGVFYGNEDTVEQDILQALVQFKKSAEQTYAPGAHYFDPPQHVISDTQLFP